MTNVAKIEDKQLTVPPIKPAAFGASQHIFQTFSAMVPGDTPKGALTDYRYWAHVAPQLKAGSEVRVLAEDCSFRAIILCTYAQGSQTVMRIVEFAQLEHVDYDELDKTRNGFKVINRGAIGYCIQDVNSGKMVKSGLKSATEAHKHLDEYIQALNA